MIASDVGMKFEPDALYAIVVWAIGRQKLVECALGSSTLVDGVVVHDEVASRSVEKALTCESSGRSGSVIRSWGESSAYPRKQSVVGASAPPRCSK